MLSTRHRMLTALLAVVLALAAAVLFDVLGTVFFAVTAAYVLVPVHRWLVARGLSRRWASVAASLGAAVAVLVPVALVFYLVYRRREALIGFIGDLPATASFELFGMTYTADFAVVFQWVQGYLSAAAIAAAGVVPVLALKFALFVVVVFALLVRWNDARRAVLAPIPDAYHDVAAAFHERVSATLFAIYVLQAATAAGTFALALPVFVAFGLPFPVTLAFVAGVLQFLPIVGPSVVVALATGYLAALDQVTTAVVFLVVALVVVAGLPDVLIRPRLASETAHLPGSLYFVGFVGGLLTVGAVGVIAGPLAVALVVEAMALLAAENGHPVGDSAGPDADVDSASDPGTES